MIPIREIYLSIQGEGIKTGFRTIFVRVAGCNFAKDKHPCSYCDTSYAWYSRGAIKYEVGELVDEVLTKTLEFGTKEVCLTGGEPLSIEGINELIRILTKRTHLTVETNGSYPIWHEHCCWSVDIKCPSSGNEKFNHYENLGYVNRKDQVKFVIGTRGDYEFAKRIINSWPCLTSIIFQPALVGGGGITNKILAEWMIEDKDCPARFGIQTHKVIWKGRKRGI